MASSSSQEAVFAFQDTRQKAIRFGTSFRSTPGTPSFASVRYNHKPDLRRSNVVQASITRHGKEGVSGLTIVDSSEEYKYEGIQAEDECALVLMPDENGQDYLLERLETAWTFNLSAAPWEQDRKKLMEQYSNLTAEDAATSDSEAQSTGDLDDEELDMDNPFDWRHYFAPTSPNAQAATRPVPTSFSPAPSHNSASGRDTPVVRSGRKSANPMLANQRRPRHSQSRPYESAPKRRKSSPSPPFNPSIPQVRVSSSVPKSTRSGTLPRRKHIEHDIQLGDSDVGDDGIDFKNTDVGDSFGLVLDDTTRQSSRRGRRTSDRSTGKHNLGVARAQGPISLRSAASSPGSRSASPAPPGPFREDELVLEGDARHSPQRARRSAHDDDDKDNNNDVDNDVEDLVLPSPARIKVTVPTTSASSKVSDTPVSTVRRKNSAGNALSAVPADDDDDELEAGLMEAMMADDDEADHAAGTANLPVDDEEESEEE